MKMEKTYQYELVKKLSFKRWGGTDDELKAAKIIWRQSAIFIRKMLPALIWQR